MIQNSIIEWRYQTSSSSSTSSFYFRFPARLRLLQPSRLPRESLMLRKVWKIKKKNQVATLSPAIRDHSKSFTRIIVIQLSHPICLRNDIKCVPSSHAESIVKYPSITVNIESLLWYEWSDADSTVKKTSGAKRPAFDDFQRWRFSPIHRPPPSKDSFVRSGLIWVWGLLTRTKHFSLFFFFYRVCAFYSEWKRNSAHLFFYDLNVNFIVPGLLLISSLNFFPVYIVAG